MQKKIFKNNINIDKLKNDVIIKLEGILYK